MLEWNDGLSQRCSVNITHYPSNPNSFAAPPTNSSVFLGISQPSGVELRALFVKGTGCHAFSYIQQT